MHSSTLHILGRRLPSRSFGRRLAQKDSHAVPNPGRHGHVVLVGLLRCRDAAGDPCVMIRRYRGADGVADIGYVVIPIPSTFDVPDPILCVSQAHEGGEEIAECRLVGILRDVHALDWLRLVKDFGALQIGLIEVLDVLGHAALDIDRLRVEQNSDEDEKDDGHDGYAEAQVRAAHGVDDTRRCGSLPPAGVVPSVDVVMVLGIGHGQRFSHGGKLSHSGNGCRPCARH
mmetsp:Transcript_8629/g.23301  ORF Transcript_8629/g.23301 Transcript_8629/m.23301 type:complete len:229 (+) Transcript_8629:358-1044(+)